MNRGNPTGYPENHQAIMGYDRWGAGKIIIMGKKDKSRKKTGRERETRLRAEAGDRKWILKRGGANSNRRQERYWTKHPRHP
jgi:hypothetical protein